MNDADLLVLRQIAYHTLCISQLHLSLLEVCSAAMAALAVKAQVISRQAASISDRH